MVELLTDYTTQIYHVLSTDSRPDADPGAQLREIDTGKRYIFDGNSWNELAAGGTTPTLITKTFTENGTYVASSDNADGYSSVTVNVPSTGYVAGDWCDFTKPTGKVENALAINSNSYAYQYMLYGRTGITELSLPNATGLPQYFAIGCPNLRTVNLPLAENLNMRSLYGISAEYLVLPSMRTNSQYALGGNTHLRGVDFGKTQSDGEYYNNLFNGCTNLDIIVLRASGLQALNNINVFTNTPFASDGSGGTLYVPQALISSYEAATNWSTILGYENNSIQAIEGSIYETQYVDGTPIS